MTNNRFKFTQSKLDKLPLSIEKAQEIYWDSETECFGVKVGKKKKSYFVQRKKDGKSKFVTIGSTTEISLEAARDAGKQRLLDIKKGIDPDAVAKQQKARDMTFHELFEMYMTLYSIPQKRSSKYDEREINKFLPHWFKRKLSSIGKPEITILLQKVHNENGLYQSNRLLERIRSMFNKAIDEWGWMGTNPTQGIKKYHEESRDRFLMPEELGPFFRALELEQNHTVHDYILISLFTGARKTNVLMMRWEELDFTYNLWRIPKTKNNQSQSIPLVPEARELLLNRKTEMEKRKISSLNDHSNTDFGWVFEGEGKAGHLADPAKAWVRVKQIATLEIWRADAQLAQFISKVENKLALEKKYKFTSNKLVKRILSEAEKENFHFPLALLDLRLHDIRRTHGSYQVLTGASMQVIGKTLGHKSLQSTEIYARLTLDPVRASMELATSAMLVKGGIKNGLP